MSPSRLIEKLLSKEANMELKETIDLMNSDDYKERFKAEYLQVKIRYEKLRKMLVKLDAGTLENALKHYFLSRSVI